MKSLGLFGEPIERVDKILEATAECVGFRESIEPELNEPCRCWRVLLILDRQADPGPPPTKLVWARITSAKMEIFGCYVGRYRSHLVTTPGTDH